VWQWQSIVVQIHVHNHDQPDTEYPKPKPSTKQHAIVNVQLIVTRATYPEKFIRDSVFAPSVLLSIVNELIVYTCLLRSSAALKLHRMCIWRVAFLQGVPKSKPPVPNNEQILRKPSQTLVKFWMCKRNTALVYGARNSDRLCVYETWKEYKSGNVRIFLHEFPSKGRFDFSLLRRTDARYSYMSCTFPYRTIADHAN